MKPGTPVPSHGEAVEDRARQIAARLGLADFVYRPQLVSRGGANREPGDAILYANGRGAVIQVKARDLDAAARDGTAEKVQRWIEKHGAKAYRQGQGTRRQLMARQAEGRPVVAIPVRASHLSPADQGQAALVLDMDVANWPTIVVFDHPGADRAVSPEPADAFWITLPDWLDLHRAIRSTTGLLDYVHRVLAADPTPRWTLGTERHRFAEAVRADRKYASEGGSGSRPYLDYSMLDDPVGVELYRDVLERIWPEDGIGGASAPRARRPNTRARRRGASTRASNSSNRTARLHARWSRPHPEWARATGAYTRPCVPDRPDQL